MKKQDIRLKLSHLLLGDVVFESDWLSQTEGGLAENPPPQFLVRSKFGQGQCGVSRNP